MDRVTLASTMLAALALGCPASGPFDLEKVVEFTERPIVKKVEPEGVVDLSFLPDGSGAYIAAYRDGLIEWRNVDHSLRGSMTLPVRRGNECGVISMVVDPGFMTNGLVYIAYCAPEAGSHIERFVWNDGGVPQTINIVTSTASPNNYHNVAGIGFDDAGNLWFGYGDGNTPLTSQDKTTFRGKLSRVTPYRDDRPGYSIPEDNPFVGDDRMRDEVIAYGLRNPFRVDYHSGLWIVADVGASNWEEVNLVRMDGPKNAGFHLCEGHQRLQDYEWTGEPCPPMEDYLAPALVYPHTPDSQQIKDDPRAYDGDSRGYAIAGGILYTGDRYDGALDGRYIYSDVIRGFVRSAQLDGDALVDDRPFGHLDRVYRWIQAPDGFVYAVAENTLYRAEPRD